MIPPEGGFQAAAEEPSSPLALLAAAARRSRSRSRGAIAALIAVLVLAPRR